MFNLLTLNNVDNPHISLNNRSHLVSGSDYKEFCFDYTGFPLEAEFYRDILASLK